MASVGNTVLFHTCGLLFYWFGSSADVICKMEADKFTWFLSKDLYYMLYDDVVSLQQARCICEALPQARLAIFDDQVNLTGDVSDFLTQYHPSASFWVDAVSDLLAEGSYIWGNNCTLPINTDLWEDTESVSGNVWVHIQLSRGFWKYFGTADPAQGYHPLCQSAKAPFNYLPTPPKLTWVPLGEVGHMFGFSNEKLSLQDARAACQHQAGKVYLASLDELYTEVSEYILDNYSNRTYWLDATVANDSVSHFLWTSGGPVDSMNFTSLALDRSVVMTSQHGAMTLTESTGTCHHYFVCEGYPAPEPGSSEDAASLLSWVTLGNPGRNFSFSEDKKTFLAAREACASQPGIVRLAVLDTLFEEVEDWVQNNYRDRLYWVDLYRTEDSRQGFVWGNGKTSDLSLRETDDFFNYNIDMEDYNKAATAAVISTRGIETAASNNGITNYYLCEQVSDVVLEWRLLGNPGKLFGFSRTPSWGYQWAKDACSGQLGDVRLASLDTHFDDVRQVAEAHYRDIQFWVDATLSAEAKEYLWSSGVRVDSSMWATKEPTSMDSWCRLMNHSLSGYNRPNEPFHFICQGNPASPVGESLFSSPCLRESQALETTATVTTEETTSLQVDADMAPTTLLKGAVTDMSHGTSTDYSGSISNFTKDQMLQLVQEIQDDLILDKRNLSASKRKLTTADDNRMSAQALGWTGCLTILVVVSFIVIPDVTSATRAVYVKLLTLKEWGVASSERLESGQGEKTLRECDDDRKCGKDTDV